MRKFLVFLFLISLCSFSFGLGGSGTAGDPYTIANCVDLQDMNTGIGTEVYFELTADIDCAATIDWNGGNGFNPIGEVYENYCGIYGTVFAGHLDGKYHTISNLYINKPDTGSSVGLFGCMHGGSAKNLALVDFNIWNGADVYGVTAGFAGTIANADVNGIYLANGTIGSANDVYTGALAGRAYATEESNDTNITNCFQRNVSIYADNANKTAGFIGSAAADPGATIVVINNYSTGHVQAIVVGEIQQASGFLSDKDQFGRGTYERNYWDVNTSSATSNATGTATPLSTVQSYQQASYVGWDFDNIWIINEDINYPALYSFVGDIVAPTTIDNDFNKGWQNTDANIEFKCTDAYGSCKNFYYGLNDANYQLGWGGDLNIGIVLDYDYNHEIWYWSDDDSDNNGTPIFISLAIDKVAPTTVDNDFNTAWQNTDANIQFSCTDENAGCRNFYYGLNDVNYQIGWGIDENIGIVLDYDYNHEIFYWSDDNTTGVGDNNGVVVLIYLAIDKETPTIDHNAFDFDTAWFNFDVNINFSCTDINAGCRNFYYGIIGDANYQFGWGVDLNIGIPVTTDGNTEIFFWSDDNSFGVGDNNSASTYLNFGLDSTKPTTEWDKDSNSWYISNQTMSFSSVDATSGGDYAKYRYKLLPDGDFILWQTGFGPVVMNTEGRWRVEFYSVDNAGNTSDANTQFFFLDKTSPTVSSDATGDWNLMSPAFDVNLHMVAFDVLSGLDVNKFRLDDYNSSVNNWGPWQDFDSNIMLDWNAFGDGNFGVQYYVTDLAGNDSNSDANSTLVYVLMDQNGPEWPTAVSPTSGIYEHSVSITCGSQNWIRDLNYVIDYYTIIDDWNQVYDGTSNSFDLNIERFPVNTDMTFRCKAIDPDKNSGYFTAATPIGVNVDSDFNAINTALPDSTITLYSASAPFSVYASDAVGVSFCTFEIYKDNSATMTADFNGTPPADDLNNGTWSYTYTNLVTGNLVKANIYCYDNEGNESPTLQTENYTVNITPPSDGAPTGGGRGGAVTITKITIDLNALVFDPPAIDVFLIYAPFEQNEQVYLHMIEGPVAIEGCYFSSDFEDSNMFSCEVVDSSKARVLLNYNDPEIFSDLVETQLVIVSGGRVAYMDIRDRVINVAAYFPFRDVFTDSFPPILANPYIFGLDDDGRIVGLRYWFLVTFIAAIIVGSFLLLKYKKGGFSSGS